MKLEFSRQILDKDTHRPNLLKILPVGAEFFNAYRGTDGRTGMTKLIVASRNFANSPN